MFSGKGGPPSVKYIAILFVFAAFTASAVLAADTPAVVTVRPEPVLPRDIMTNEGLVLLSDAGFSDSFIVVKIQLSRTRFDTSAEGLAALRRNSVSEELVLFILAHEARPVVGVPPRAQAIVPMKVVKQRVLVPIEQAPADAVSFLPSPVPVTAVRAKRSWWPWSRARWYGSSPVAAGYGGPGYPQAAYATPGRPILHSPAFPASAPVLTPVGSDDALSYGR